MPNPASSKRVSILMPAYNEGQSIERVVRKCVGTLKSLGLDGEVVVTNDGSTDSTAKALDSLKKELTNLIVVSHDRNMGYGQALFDAIKQSQGDIVVTIDSDGQFDITELPLLLDCYNKGFLVVAGFRREKKDSVLKVFANKVLNFLTNVMFGLKLKDANSAFKLFDASVIRALKIESRGYQTPTEIMVKCKVLGYPIAEVGITHAFREKGKSALGVVKTTYEMLVFFVYLRLKVYLYRRKVLNTI